MDNWIAKSTMRDPPETVVVTGNLVGNPPSIGRLLIGNYQDDIVGDGDHIIGNNCKIKGNKNQIFGNDCEVEGDNNIVVGNGSRVIGQRNTIVGDIHTLRGEDNIIFGRVGNPT